MEIEQPVATRYLDSDDEDHESTTGEDNVDEWIPQASKKSGTKGRSSPQTRSATFKLSFTKPKKQMTNPSQMQTSTAKKSTKKPNKQPTKSSTKQANQKKTKRPVKKGTKSPTKKSQKQPKKSPKKSKSNPRMETNIRPLIEPRAAKTKARKTLQELTQTKKSEPKRKGIQPAEIKKTKTKGKKPKQMSKKKKNYQMRKRK